MSNARKLKMAVDLPAMQETAHDLGYTVQENCIPRGYYRKEMADTPVCNLVLKSNQDTYDIGFTKNPVTGEVDMIADHHGGTVQKKMETLLPAYYEKLIQLRGRRAGFRVTNRAEDKEKIYITVRR